MTDAAEPNSMQPRRLLIIDDEPDIREVAALSLEEMAGWQVLSAGSGAEGAALAAAQAPDAILLDVMMPEMDGPTTLQALRSNPSTQAIPVIFMTAKVQLTDRKRLQELGAAGIIAKPFDPMLLAQEVAAILGWGF
jgi:CheY-like chemotaxis protein